MAQKMQTYDETRLVKRSALSTTGTPSEYHRNPKIMFCVLLTSNAKTITKYREFFLTLFAKTTDFQLVSNFEQMRTVTILGEHVILAHIP